MTTKRFLLALIAITLFLPLAGCGHHKKCCDTSLAPPPAACCPTPGPGPAFVPGP